MTKQTPKLIQGTDAIRKEIGLIQTAGKKLDGRIQVAGLSILAHIDAHGDITLANNLLAAMPNGSRRKALVEWMLAHGKLAKNEDKATNKEVFFVYDKSRTTQLDLAIESPWYEFAKSSDDVQKAWDAQAAVKAMLARFDGAKAKGTIAGVTPELEAALAVVRKAVAA